MTVNELKLLCNAHTIKDLTESTGASYYQLTQWSHRGKIPIGSQALIYIKLLKDFGEEELKKRKIKVDDKRKGD